MADKSNKNNIIIQSGILAAAGFISRIIGLLYRKPLTAVIGAEGNGYYQVAYNVYTMVLLISSYSIPSAISKVIAQKLAVKEYRNAHRIYICSIWYVLAVGGVASLFLLFGAGFLVEGASVQVLRVFAPTIVFSGLLGVMRGYFQAHRSMIQTSVSQILEQIVNAAVSIGAAVLIINACLGTLDWSDDTLLRSQRSMYGAIGSALGTGAGVLVALLFMCWIYLLNKKLIHRRISRDQSRYVESYRDITRTILSVVTPFILSTAVYNLNAFVDQSIYIKLLHYFQGIDVETLHYNYGILSEATTVSNIPIAFASAMAAAMIPAITQLSAVGDMDTAGKRTALATKTTMIISIPCAVGLFALARPVIGLLYPQEDTIKAASYLLMALSLSIVFYALSTLSNSVLQGIGKVNVPIRNAAVALVVQAAVLVVLLLFTDLGLFTLPIASTVHSGLMCLLNQLSIRKAMGYRQEIAKTFIIPLLTSVIMGAAAYFIYKGLHLLTGSNLISVIPAVIVAVGIYFVLLVLLKGVTEEELRSFPKGHLLIRAAKKCRLLK